MTTRLLYLLLVIPTLAFGQIQYHRTNGFLFTGGPMYGDGSGLTNLPTASGEILSAKSVMNYGAVADGTTDCSLAFSNANHAAQVAKSWVYIPSGTYLITNLTATCAGWFGDGTNSILKFKEGTNGAAITSSSGCSLRDFSVWGQSAIYYGVSSNTPGTRVGVLHDPLGETEVARLNIWGFDKAALEVAGTATTERTLFTKFTGNWLHDSYAGFTNRAGTAEYCEANNNRIWRCYNSLSANAANMKISGNIISDGYNGGYWGVAADNRGHSTWINNTFNHMGGSVMIIRSNFTGGSFIGNSLLASGAFYIYNCKGLMITGNLLGGTSLNVDTSPNHNSKSILFYGNQYVTSDGEMIDYSGQLFHWGNYNSTTGVMVDGTGAPYYTAGGFGFVEGPLFAVRGSAGIGTSLWVTNTVTATNFALSKPQWIDVPANYAFSSIGPNAPSLTAVTNNSAIQELAFDNGDMLYAQAQFPHNIATTNSTFPVQWVEPHVHFSTVGTLDSTHSNVTWRIEWELASIGQLYKQGTNSVTVGVSANFTHYLAELGHITNTPPAGISAVFRCRLTRPASVAQDYSNAHDVLLDGFDVHVPVGNVTALGSRDETSQ